MQQIRSEEALNYHSRGRKGKIEVIASKPCLTSRDLSLAYTPGVATPCLEIARDVDQVYQYTAKGNLVAVISNGTAVLGLGDIGAEAGKPVMEGKGVLFKRFADIDVFDLELNSHDPEEIIRTVQILEPTFGGINLEDIKAPECFIIEERLKESMNIPVFHDDQHGTAIISCAALINAAELAGKELFDLRIVVNGAGAAAISCCNLYVQAGANLENIFMFDSRGCIDSQRQDLNSYKQKFAKEKTYPDLAAAIKGADVFIGLSVANVVSKEMVASMAENPIIFAMANPDPEITYNDAVQVRSDVIMATGRSDFPNQVNNVLGFPFIFRGALDTRARQINEQMKMAAVQALAKLAKEPIPEMVAKAYGGEEFSYGRNYIIPKPFDPRVLWYVAPAVARAAMDSGVARLQIEDWSAYQDELQERLGYSKEVIRVMIQKARKHACTIVYPEGEEDKIIHAAHTAYQEGIAKPVLLGSRSRMIKKIQDFGYPIQNFQLINPSKSEDYTRFAHLLHEKRQRRGVTMRESHDLLKNPIYYGSMMLDANQADGLISGLTTTYPETLKPALQCIGIRQGLKVVSGLYIVAVKNDVYFFADTTVNINPNAEQLADIARAAAATVREFDIEPKIAMLSFSNFGSVRSEESNKVSEAVAILREREPSIQVEGEMQADTALSQQIREEYFPFNRLKGKANVLVFPELNAGNIAYKMMAQIGGATVIGPILMGMAKPVHVLQRGASIDDIINMTAIASVEASKNNATL